MNPAQAVAFKATVAALTARGVAVTPEVVDLARAVYTVRCDVEDANPGMSDEVLLHMWSDLGLDDLEATVVDLADELSAAGGEPLFYAPDWYRQDRQDRQRRQERTL